MDFIYAARNYSQALDNEVKLATPNPTHGQLTSVLPWESSVSTNVVSLGNFHICKTDHASHWSGQACCMRDNFNDCKITRRKQRGQ